MKTLPENLLSAFAAAKEDTTPAYTERLWELLSTETVELIQVIDSSELRGELASMWLRASLMLMQEFDAFGITRSEVDAVCRLVSDEEALHATLRHADSARVLALYCQTVLSKAIQNHLDDCKPAIKNILCMWTGVNLANNETVTIEKVTDILYGPMTYGLYRPDVETEVDLPAHLCRQNVPVLGALKTTTTYRASASVDMPSDLFANAQP